MRGQAKLKIVAEPEGTGSEKKRCETYIAALAANCEDNKIAPLPATPQPLRMTEDYISQCSGRHPRNSPLLPIRCGFCAARLFRGLAIPRGAPICERSAVFIPGSATDPGGRRGASRMDRAGVSPPPERTCRPKGSSRRRHPSLRRVIRPRLTALSKGCRKHESPRTEKADPRTHRAGHLEKAARRRTEVDLRYFLCPGRGRAAQALVALRSQDALKLRAPRRASGDSP